MSATGTKLEEARFFVRQMEGSQFEYPTFAYHLSAFVSAARSVLWVMQHEFHEAPGWKTWYDSREPNAEDTAFLRSLNDLRVAAVKFGTPSVENHLEIRIPEAGVTPDLVRFLNQHSGRRVNVVIDPSKTMGHTVVHEGSIELQGQGVCLFPVVAEFPNESVVSVCQRYVEWLAGLVRECETRFGA